jgi:hypothetical protein
LKKINNDGIQIDVSPTTKVNLNNLKKYLPSFLKLINQSISNVIIGNLYPEYDFEEFFKKYLKSIGLKPSKKYKLYNGDLECSFRRFDIYEGSKRGSN